MLQIHNCMSAKHNLQKNKTHTYFSLISQASYFLHEYENVIYTAMRFPTESQNLPNDISEVQMDSWADTCVLQAHTSLYCKEKL
jgi:hypothetical protein